MTADMDEFPRAMYHATGRAVQTDSDWRGYRVVADAAEQLAAEADGWRTRSDECEAPVIPPDDAPPTRDELERKAAELGIKVDGRWGDKRISDAITAALKA